MWGQILTGSLRGLFCQHCCRLIGTRSGETSYSTSLLWMHAIHSLQQTRDYFAGHVQQGRAILARSVQYLLPVQAYQGTQVDALLWHAAALLQADAHGRQGGCYQNLMSLWLVCVPTEKCLCLLSKAIYARMETKIGLLKAGKFWHAPSLEARTRSPEGKTAEQASAVREA